MNESQTVQPVKQTKSYRNSFLVWGILGSIFLIIAAIQIPCLFASRRSANEASAIASLRDLNSSQTIFFEKEKIYCGSLTELFKANLIDERLAKGKKSGYIFEVVKSEKNCELTARPISNSEGKRSFYLSNSEFRFSNDENKLADSTSKILQ